MLKILNCLAIVDCAVAEDNSLVNRRCLRVEENNLTISQVTRPTKRQRGTFQRRRIRRICQLISTLLTPRPERRRKEDKKGGNSCLK